MRREIKDSIPLHFIAANENQRFGVRDMQLQKSAAILSVVARIVTNTQNKYSTIRPTPYNRK